jgi:hypothetical protein
MSISSFPCYMLNSVQIPLLVFVVEEACAIVFDFDKFWIASEPTIRNTEKIIVSV